jgi:hypothetical protein
VCGIAQHTEDHHPRLDAAHLPNRLTDTAREEVERPVMPS